MDRREFVRHAAAGIGGLLMASDLEAASPTGPKALPRRPLGRTGHHSSVITLGGMTIREESQEDVNQLMDEAIAAGMNHIDAAPSYGNCEVLFGNALAGRREQVFIGCKTGRRDRAGAREELHRSLERLQTDHIDLYQMHGLGGSEERKQALGPDGALEAFLEARDEGLVRFLGITGHNPDDLLAALDEFAFDTVMFPINFILQHHGFGTELLQEANRRGVGVLAIKPIAERQRREGEPKRYPKCWYKPLDTNEEISLAVWYMLAQPVTTIVPSADMRLFRRALAAAQHWRKLTEAEHQQLTRHAAETEPLFPA